MGMPATTGTRSERAAHNNAVWCHTVCRAHGLPGEFFGTHWLQRRSGPPHYPNLVTLVKADDPAAVVGAIEQLTHTLAFDGWGVKDSHAQLDLGALGFEPLFEASWIWREPSPAPAAATHGLRWARVADAAQLRRWEHAWVGAETDGGASLFPPSLLAEPDVSFFAGWDGERIVAGGISNRSGAVAGLSNVFAAAHLQTSAHAAVAALAQAQWPGLPLVGYESGAWLAAACACGFEAAGPLRVWLRRAAAAAPT